MVIDGREVLTSSFNFTKAAEDNNAENLLVIDDAEFAEQYTANRKRNLAHSQRYNGRSEMER